MVSRYHGVAVSADRDAVTPRNRQIKRLKAYVVLLVGNEGAFWAVE